MNMASPLFPYYGSASASERITPELVLGLSNRGQGLFRQNTSMYAIDGPMLCLYYAYPVAYGPSVFTNLVTKKVVGWDGACRDRGVTTGPIVLDIMFADKIVPFYVYQTTTPEISPERATVFWEVR